MTNLSVCKDCPDNDDFYGCQNDECETYQDIKADSMYQEYLENKREEDRIEQNN